MRAQDLGQLGYVFWTVGGREGAELGVDGGDEDIVAGEGGGAQDGECEGVQRRRGLEEEVQRGLELWV